MSDREASASRGLQDRWLWILALTGLSVVKTGYYVFYDNHATQLPLVFQLQEPRLFPADPFLGAMQGYMGWIWVAVARLGELVSLELILALLFLLTRWLLVYSSARLGSVLVPQSRWAPWLSALLMALGPYPILGDGTLVEVYWEQSSMFMPLFVLALALLLEGKPGRFCLLFGIAYLVNPLYGSWAGLFFGLTWLVDPSRIAWHRVIRFSPLFLLPALPVFLGGVDVLSQPEVDMNLWMWVNRLLISPHAFPETWPAVLFWRFLIFTGLVVAAGRILEGRRSRLSRLTLAWAALACAFLALAPLAASGLSRALLVFQPARAAELFYLAGGVTVASVVAYLLESRHGGVAYLSCVGALSSLWYLLVPEFRDYAFLPSLLFGALGAVALWTIWRRQGARDRRWMAAAGVWLLFAAGLTVSASVARRIKHEGSVARAMYRLPIPDMVQLAEWAETNTAIDDVFFHDPVKWEWAQFRYLARRPVYTTWKDASAVLWDPSFATEWQSRFAAFGFRDELRDQWDLSQQGEVKRIRRSLMSHYLDLGDEQLREMADRYRIDYWIAPSWTASGFPEVARAGSFKVLDVRQSR